MEPTGPRLLQTHRDLFALANDADNLRLKLYKRATLGLESVSVIRSKGPYAVESARSAQARAKAKDEEKRHALFEAAVDPYWPEELARYAKAALGLDQPLVKALLRVNDAEEESLARVSSRLSPKLWIGFILTAGAFFANQVPKELFKYLDSKNWLDSAYYTQYRAFAFLMLLFALAYVGLILIALNPLMGRSSPKQIARDLRRVRLVLVHLDAAFEISGQKQQTRTKDGDGIGQ